MKTSWKPRLGELVREEWFGNTPGPIGTVFKIEEKQSGVFDRINVYASVLWADKGIRVHPVEILEPVFEG